MSEDNALIPLTIEDQTARDRRTIAYSIYAVMCDIFDDTAHINPNTTEISFRYHGQQWTIAPRKATRR